MILGTAVAGISTLILGCILLFVLPSQAELAEGFHTPIIAFEFAKTAADVSFLAGSGETERINRESMALGIAWDMLFPFAYAGFLGLLLLGTRGQGRRIADGGAVISISIVPFDLYENGVMLDLLSRLQNHLSLTEPLATLSMATWIKWGGISMAMFLFAINLKAKHKPVSALIAALPAVSIFACWIAGTVPWMAEMMSLLLALSFVYFTVVSVSEGYKTMINRPNKP